jgi:hypothetical protein
MVTISRRHFLQALIDASIIFAAGRKSEAYKIPFSLRAVGATLPPSCRLYEPEALRSLGPTDRRPSFRRKPESSLFNQLQSTWTPPGLDPGSTGVTAFYGFLKGSGVQGSILIPGLHLGRVFTIKASVSSGLIQHLKLNWQLLGKMNICNEDFGS